jgi:hypothetical protein
VPAYQQSVREFIRASETLIQSDHLSEDEKHALTEMMLRLKTVLKLQEGAD